MQNKLIGVLILGLALLVGCSTPSGSLPGGGSSSSGGGSVAAVSMWGIDPDTAPPIDLFWINPDHLEVSNLQAGSIVDTFASGEQIGVQIHNGGRTTENKRVTNTYNDPNVTISLGSYLYAIGDDVFNEWGLADKTNYNLDMVFLNGKRYLISLISSRAEDNLRITGYDANKKEIQVTGLADPVAGDTATRIVSVIYCGSSPKTYSVTYKVPTNPKEGYVPAPPQAQDWVTISQPLVTLNTFETRVVPISLVLLDNAIITEPDWEFWITVGEVSFGTEGAVNLQIEYNCSWFIHMK